MPPHHGRYPFSVYARLVLVVAIFAVVNTVFSKILDNVVGNFDLVSVSVLTLGLLGFAFVFAFIFWASDDKGTLGRLLGADK